VYARGPALELTTPTGAAVAATLSRTYGTMPAMTIARVGYGAGDRDFPEHANLLRVVIGETAAVDEALSVVVIEANLDDLNPQVLAYASERLMGLGALDVAVHPVGDEEGARRAMLSVVCRPEDREPLGGGDLRRDLHPRSADARRGAARPIAADGRPWRRRTARCG